MNDPTPISLAPFVAAELCLSAPGQIELLKIHKFADDFESHDDEKQEQLTKEFEAAVQSAVSKLEAAYGAAHFLVDEADMDDLPLAGVFCAAIWRFDGATLFVAASHEDRETPFLLVVGTK